MQNISAAIIERIDQLSKDEDHPTRRYLYQLHRERAIKPKTTIADLEMLAAEYGVLHHREENPEDKPEWKAPRIHPMGEDIIHHIHSVIELQRKKHPRRAGILAIPRAQLFDYIEEICNGVSMNRLLVIAHELGI